MLDRPLTFLNVVGYFARIIEKLRFGASSIMVLLMLWEGGWEWTTL